ncbi:Zonadhesin [Dirofilaria immitis]
MIFLCSNQSHWNIKQRIQLVIIIVIIVSLRISLGIKQEIFTTTTLAIALSFKSIAENINTSVFDTITIGSKTYETVVATLPTSIKIPSTTTVTTKPTRSERKSNVTTKIPSTTTVTTKLTRSERKSNVTTKIPSTTTVTTKLTRSEKKSNVTMKISKITTITTKPTGSKTESTVTAKPKKTIISTSDNIATTTTKSAIIHTTDTAIMAERTSKSIIIVEGTIRAKIIDNFNTILYEMTSPDISQSAVLYPRKITELEKRSPFVFVLFGISAIIIITSLMLILLIKFGIIFQQPLHE